MKKAITIFCLIIVIIAAGCLYFFYSNWEIDLASETQPGILQTNTPAENNININQPPTIPLSEQTEITFLISTADPLKFCNGADMDSAGYKKTITKEVKQTLAIPDLTRTQLIKKTLLAASQTAEMNFPQADEQKDNYLKIIGDTAYIQPTDGWAGVSIALCCWQPFVEVNLLRFPEIKKVSWLTDWAEWDKLQE